MNKKIILIVFVVLVIIFGFYFVTQKLQKKETLNDPMGMENIHYRDMHRKAVIFWFSNALNKFKEDNGDYPKLNSDSQAGNGIFSEDLSVNSLVPEYLEKVTKDPVNEDEFKYVYKYSNGNFIFYMKLEDEDKKLDGEKLFCIDSQENKNPVFVNSTPSPEDGCVE